ncbi:MAG: hypothetical protein ACI835_000579 [Planctomycetota bacterium]|jgi:hypothetical protein
MSARQRAFGTLLLWAATLWVMTPPSSFSVALRSSSLGERLLGPVASLVASAQWVRFDLALRVGEPERAYELAERAIELDPGAWQGWFTFASHLIYDRGAETLEPDPHKQRAWIRAGLDMLTEGVKHARDPAELEIISGSCLTMLVALRARSIEWPGGAEAAIAEGLEALQRAAALGHPHAAVFEDNARRLLSQLRAGE